MGTRGLPDVHASGLQLLGFVYTHISGKPLMPMLATTITSKASKTPVVDKRLV